MMTKTQTIKNNLYLGALMMLAALPMMLTAAGPAHASPTFTVNSASDLADVNIGDGVCDADFAAGNLCTLRAAINEANAVAGEDTIEFDIPGTGMKTISPQTNLPNIIGDPVIIDGFTHPGASSNTLTKGTNAKLMIEFNGSGVTGTFESTGLRISAPNSTVQGLTINRFTSGVSVFAERVSVSQNFISTDPSGTLDRGNSGSGIFVQGFGNVIGGASPQDANLISGNDEAGISIRSQASQTAVSHNLIGTDKSGTRGLGNSEAGVETTDSSHNFAENNTIAFNGGDGVRIEGGGGRTGVVVSANPILSNSIFSNGGLGINLVDSSVLVPAGESEGSTANDPGDTDDGPNDLQNKPLLDSARTVSGKTTVAGRLSSRPDETYTIQFFSSPSGTDEGKTLLGQKTVKTDGTGNASFIFSAPAVPVGQNVTATAAREFTLDTSEFSNPRTVKDVAAPTVKRVVPADSATGVAPSANVSAFFSEAMKASTINTTTVTLKKASTTTRMAATVAYDAPTKKAILNPKTNLKAGATYVATVSSGSKDLAGNALDQNGSLAGNQAKTWKFKVKK